MSNVQASCPGCGAAVPFTVASSIVTICPFCRSVVARGDRRLEDLGKLAELVDTGSPLQIGLKGRYDGVPFHLTGRSQLGHPKGGVWDEWYASFSDGRTGWLAEAQGRFFMTFHEEGVAADELPAFGALRLGGEVEPLGDGPTLVVAEKGEARPLSAEGEIPYRLEPGDTYYFADLSGRRGEFGTLDYSESPPRLFLGREVTLDDLGVPASVKAAHRERRQVEGLHLNCPNCGGGLELRAPGQTERVTCPSCSGLLDVTQGNLQFLQALEPPEVAPVLPLGAVGEVADGKMMVIGFMQRSVEFDGIRYRWEEYLLYEPRVGFRWLVRSDDHWNYVTPLPPGQVSGRGNTAEHDGKTFKMFQKAVANVDFVLGEFYWKVQAGETVYAKDFVAPPLMLSREKSVVEGDDEEQGEINWSLGTYLPREEVQKAFGLTDPLRVPTTVAPNQPFLHKGIYKWWLICLLIIILLGPILMGTTRSNKVYEQTFTVDPTVGAETGKSFFSETGELEFKGRRNIRVTARANVNNSWVFVDGALVDEESGLVQSFAIPVEYYSGVEDGEAWSEGSTEDATYLSSVPPGKYTLALEVTGGDLRGQPVQLTVRVEQGKPRFVYWFLTLLAVSVLPLAVLIYQMVFESRRWQDSNCQ